MRSAAVPALAVYAGLGLLLSGCAAEPARAPAPARPGFTDVTAASGLPAGGLTSGVALVDLDEDGRLDLLLGRHDGVPLAFRSEVGLTFTPLADWGSGLPVVDHHATVADDLDGDGRPDFYFVVGAERGEGIGRNVLVLSRRQEGDVAGALAVQDPLGRGRGGLAVDLDRDFAPELLVLNFRTAMRAFDVRPGAPATDLAPGLFGREPGADDPGRKRARQDWLAALIPADADGDGRTDLLAFGPPSARLLRGSPSGFMADVEALPFEVYVPAPAGGVWGDVDGDGHPDLYLVYGPDDAPGWFRGGRNRLLLWRQGRFVESPDSAGALGGRGTAAAAADLDNDGRLDLVVQQASLAQGRTRLLVLWNEGRGSLAPAQELGGGPGLGEGVVAADLDGDGDLDLLSLQGSLADGGEPDPGRDAGVGGGVRLYRNDLGASRWLSVRLEAGGRSPYGARVELETAGGKQARQFWPAQAAGSAFRLPLHFGLRGAERVSRLTVTWPWGEVTELAGIEPDREATVRAAAARDSGPR